MKSYLKSELARAAGVSCSTFKRWLRQQNEKLSQWGVTPRSQLLPPVAVEWICGQYGIDEGGTLNYGVSPFGRFVGFRNNGVVFLYIIYI